MSKIWQSKSTKLHPLVEKYTVGNDYKLDKKILPYDIEASKAHAAALLKIKIITPAEYKKLIGGLNEVLCLFKQGKFKIKY